MNRKIPKTSIKVPLSVINILNGRTDPMFLVKMKNSVMLLLLLMELLLLLLVLLKAKRFFGKILVLFFDKIFR